MTLRAVLASAVLALAGAAVPAAAAPVVDQMVVFRDGDTKISAPGTASTRVRASGRRCRVPRATPMAALVRSRVARLKVLDFTGSCDPSGLFVKAIGPDANRGQRGWVYKVGNRQGTTSAADPSGPFGSGRFKRRVRITWFYCAFQNGGCQRTLGLRVLASTPGAVKVRVTAFDDEGHGARSKGARVHAGTTTATTDARGEATLPLAAGRHRLYASKPGAVRSFGERLDVE